MKSTKKRREFMEAMKQEFGDATTISRPQLKVLVAKHKVGWPNWITSNKEFRAGRGTFRIPVLEEEKKEEKSQEEVTA